MKPSFALRRYRRLLIVIAACPVVQFFSGCFPNIPGLPNVPGAVNFEIQNLINRVVFETISVVVSNLLNL